jgi:signal transduction histidine kinase
VTAFAEGIEAHSRLRHAAQFYEDDDFLLGAVSRFVGAGLRAGEGLIVVATRAHLDALSRTLEGFGLGRAVDSGRARLFDARDMLDRFIVGGMPDRARFRAIVCPEIDGCRRAARSRGDMAGLDPVGAFGEMVDLLCRDGNAVAALRLEDLWTEICHEKSVSLLCGYALQSFASEADAARFEAVCACHDRVIPAEGYALLDDPAARQREIATLQRRSKALEGEIQKRTELEHALRQAMREQRRAEHTSRMRDQLLAGIAQDLRLPLKAIAGWAALLRSGQDIDPIEAAETIEVAARAQASLLDEVTDASRVLGGTLRIHPGPVDLAFVLREAVEAIAEAAMTKGITLGVGIESDPCLAHVDAHRIEQVFSNLLSNAVQFASDGGKVDARLARSEDTVELTVRDDGCGISPSALPFVFDRLRRIEESAPQRPSGLRLGLAVTRHLVELHGGTIEARSEGEGRGSTFKVKLPRGTHATSAR